MYREIVWKCLLAFLVFTAIKLTWAQEGYELNLEKFECKSEDPKGYVKFLNCSLYELETKNVTSFKFDFEYSKDVYDFRLNLMAQFLRNNSRITLFNYTNIDGCELMRQKKNLPMVSFTVDSWHRFGHMPNSCPIRKGEHFYLRGYSVRGNIIRFLMRELLLFSFDFVIHKQKVIQASGIIRGVKKYKYKKSVTTKKS